MNRPPAHDRLLTVPNVLSGLRLVLIPVFIYGAMLVGQRLPRSEAVSLNVLNSIAPRVAIGLHLTLTAPFRPLTMHFKPVDGGLFLPLPKMLQRGFVRRLDREIIQSEIATQFSAFRDLFGRTPDFADGHQHAQLFPVVRDAFLAATAAQAPNAWVRQGGQNRPLLKRLNSPKALLLDALSRQFRKRAARAKLRFNTAFAGAYDYLRKADFGSLMQQFLQGLPDGGLVMCHPGFVDDVLAGLDPMTDVREREHAYLAGDAFPRLLADSGVTLG